MNTNTLHKCIIAATMMVAASTASAHVNYSSARDFGTFSGTDYTKIITGQTLKGNYGWASGTDATGADSHKTRYFVFTLNQDAWVNLNVQGASVTTTTTFSALSNPGFSLYKGWLTAADSHDFSDDSFAINNARWGFNTGADAGKKEPSAGADHWAGSFSALSDWSIANDTAQVSTFTYIGNAADGTTANYAAHGGSASGINWDGNANGDVSATFHLTAGQYAVFIGGAQYFGALNAGADPTTTYGIQATLSVMAIPEPSTYALLSLGAMVLTAAYRRRGAGWSHRALQFQ
ncbi:MAG: PEP-CTERM sorting domain-containing protein [Chthoniobacterales bacterium]